MTSAGSFERRPTTPRRVRGGIKLRAEAETPRTWVARRWMTLVDDLLPQQAKIDGLDYARRGQTATLSIASGVVTAAVQGCGPRPYDVRWKIPVLTGDQGQRLVDAMAGEAFYSARLLVNELPAAAEDLAASIDVRLVPAASDVSLTCDCPAAAPCKHAAAVGYLLAQRFDDDPLAVFGLRGMEGRRLLDLLAAARAARIPGAAASHSEPVMHASRHEVEPLEASLDAFWRPGARLAELQRMEPPHHAPHALLRRLGPSPLPGRFPMVGLLASIYDTVSKAAIHIRDQAEGIEEE